MYTNSLLVVDLELHHKNVCFEAVPIPLTAVSIKMLWVVKLEYLTTTALNKRGLIFYKKTKVR